jgi:hypothetical protein
MPRGRYETKTNELFNESELLIALTTVKIPPALPPDFRSASPDFRRVFLLLSLAASINQQTKTCVNVSSFAAARADKNANFFVRRRI